MRARFADWGAGTKICGAPTSQGLETAERGFLGLLADLCGHARGLHPHLPVQGTLLMTFIPSSGNVADCRIND